MHASSTSSQASTESHDGRKKTRTGSRSRPGRSSEARPEDDGHEVRDGGVVPFLPDDRNPATCAGWWPMAPAEPHLAAHRHDLRRGQRVSVLSGVRPRYRPPYSIKSALRVRVVSAFSSRSDRISRAAPGLVIG